MSAFSNYIPFSLTETQTRGESTGFGTQVLSFLLCSPSLPLYTDYFSFAKQSVGTASGGGGDSTRWGLSGGAGWGLRSQIAQKKWQLERFCGQPHPSLPSLPSAAWTSGCSAEQNRWWRWGGKGEVAGGAHSRVPACNCRPSSPQSRRPASRKGEGRSWECEGNSSP